jgi:hypothetical protein
LSFTQVSQTITDSAGVAIFKIRPTEISTYRVRLLGGSVGATVTSPNIVVIVTSSEQLLVGKINALVSAISKVKATLLH